MRRLLATGSAGSTSAGATTHTTLWMSLPPSMTLCFGGDRRARRLAKGNAAWIDFTSTTPPTGQDLYATVWSAYLSGQTIGFGISGCIDGGYYLVINQISIPSM